MLREAKNEVSIEGILSEVDLKRGSFVKDGAPVENVSGTIKIRVHEKDGNILEIPVSMYSNRLTKNGTVNPAYTSIETIMNSYVSIAACGDEAKADCVRINGAKLSMNEYYGNNKQLISYPRIRASFCSRVRREDLKEHATFNVEFCVGNMGYTLDKEGNETKTYEIQGIIPMYGGRVDVIPFHTSNESVTNVVSKAWAAGDSVYAVGRLNFTSKVETVTVQLGFGDPQEQSRTINLSELLITGGNDVPLDDATAFDQVEIQKALADRKVRLEQDKEKSSIRSAQRQTPAQSSVAPSFDLGF